ncbi:MAG TPA: serine/threonine-protein kinase [Candidatus Desulfaltia sp.]|nr:serine/threonine-protein kinase [Candidatus Desulfaltia sp.]
MIGQTLKHYKIEELLGMGGMGVVYKALDTRLQRPVALKLLKPELIADPGRKSRFLVEAQSAAAVTHPAIAQVYDIDEVGGAMFIAMEFVEGRTVGQLIAEGELDLLGSVEIAFQIAEGLARAHEAKIIHRDIKSDNIMVTRDGHAKLLDFGLAKLLDPDFTQTELGVEVSRTLTRERVHTIAGTVLGTTNYMSPEQARGRPLDQRSDIFSLGVVLYEMMTGELPFRRETPLDTMHAIVFEEAKPVTTLRRNLPPQAHLIISRCLRKRPEDRYPNANGLAEDLRRLKQNIETGTSLSLPVGVRIRGWLDEVKTWIPLGSTGLIVAVAVLIATVALLFTRVQWGSLIGPAFLTYLAIRFVRNRKRRMISHFTKKVSALPEVKAVIVREDRVTVVLGEASAKAYIHITSLIDSLNSKVLVGKRVTAEIKDDLSDIELQRLVRQPGVVYVRDDIMLTTGAPGKSDEKRPPFS